MRSTPTTSQLAKTAARLQARKPLAQAMFGRGDYEPPSPIKEVKRAPPVGSVTTGMTSTRIVREKPKAR
jgi:hypothetical protein